MLKGKEKAAVDETVKKLYQAYYSSLYKFCLSKLKQNNHIIEDITQEAFVVLYNKMLEGEKITYPYAFLLKTCDNLVKRYFAESSEALKTVSIDEVINIPASNSNIDEKLTFEEYSKQFSAALNDRDAELFSLRYIEELTITEIAEACDMTIENVSTRLYRIREKLRKQFGESIY